MASSGSLLADKAFIGIEKSQLTHRRLCESKSHASDSHRSGEPAIFRGALKTIRSQKLRMLLTHRKLLQSKAIAIENDLRGTLRNFGLKVGIVGKVKFEARIRELVENLPDLVVLVEPML